MASPRTRPPALTHGLFSQRARQALLPQAEALAHVLAAGLSHEPRVLGAARDAAEATIWHRHVRTCRLEMVERAALLHGNRTAEDQRRALALAAKVKTAPPGDCQALAADVRHAHDTVWKPDLETGGDYFLQRTLERHAAQLRRLADYERRAASRRRKAIRRLDYERIEAERRRTGART